MSLLSFTYEFRDQDVTVEVLSYTPGRPGKYFGPPEDCYPSEGAEVDYRILVDGDEIHASLTEEESIDLHKEIDERMIELNNHFDWD